MIRKNEALDLIAENVADLMERQKVGTRELARMSENEPMTISRLLNRHCMPTADALYRVARALSVSLDELFEKKPS